MSKISKAVARALVLFLPLAAAWLLWSGIYTPLLLGLGALSCLLTLYVRHRMGYVATDALSLRFGIRLLRYWPWLAREVVKSTEAEVACWRKSSARPLTTAARSTVSGSASSAASLARESTSRSRASSSIIRTRLRARSSISRDCSESGPVRPSTTSSAAG